MGEEAVGGEQVAEREVAGTQLFLHQALGEDVAEAAAAELLGQHERGEPDRSCLAPDLPRHDDVRLVDLPGHRADLVASELAAQTHDLFLLVGERHELGRQPCHLFSCPDCCGGGHATGFVDRVGGCA